MMGGEILLVKPSTLLPVFYRNSCWAWLLTLPLLGWFRIFQQSVFLSAG